MASASEMIRRPTAEETLLLPTPAKIGVILLTILIESLKGYALEQAISIILLAIGACIALLAWWLASLRLRVIGMGFGILGLLSPVMLGPPQFDLPPIPVFSKQDPPIFPKQFVITRDNIDASRDDGWFREKKDSNRIILLRGVNFGGSSKIPSASDATHIKPADFYTKHRDVSFVGRPCPLAEADEHFARLASWGYNTLRLLITWEAVEHKGPGIYDYEYLAYLRELCRKAAKHGLSVFIDPHQDVWSRFTGGDGAPGWTLEKVGFKLGSELFETGAAFTQQEFGDPYPRMCWATNYARLGCSTMFTLFFAGNDFAPKTRIDGLPVQDYLQNHFVNAMKEVAKALKDEQNVIGFDTMNEPSNGYVGMEDLRKSGFPIPQAYHMSAFEGMILGAGFSRRIDLFHLPFVFNHTQLVNPNRKSVWQSPDKDVWRMNGVWDIGADGQPILLRPGHFKSARDFDFVKQYMTPFFAKVAEAVRQEIPGMAIFAEPHIDPRHPVHQHAPSKELRKVAGGSLAWAPHFYDAATLVLKTYRPWFALDVEKEMIMPGSYLADGVFKRAAVGLRRGGNGLPVLVGETGVPMDMAGSFQSGDFSVQASALNRILRSMEREFLSWTLWTYTPDNNNKRGDLWNGEDLSLWSRDQVTNSDDLNSGGRALVAAVRPYPMRIAGIPLDSTFEPFDHHKRFFLKVRLLVADQGNGLETVIFIPSLQYPKGIEWKVGGRGSSLLRLNGGSPLEQTYIWKHEVTAGATSVNPDEIYVDQWIEIEAKL